MVTVVNRLMSAHSSRCLESVEEAIPKGHILAQEFRQILWARLYEEISGDICAHDGCNNDSIVQIRWTPMSLQLRNHDWRKQYWININTLNKGRRAGIMRAVSRIRTLIQPICEVHLGELLRTLEDAEGSIRLL